MGRSSSLTGKGDRSLRGYTIADALSRDATAVPATITANGQTGWMTAEDVNTAVVSATAAGATGTSPTLQFIVETSDEASGNVATLATLTNLTGAGTVRARAVGFDHQWRIRWVVGGTTPSFTGVAVTGATK